MLPDRQGNVHVRASFDGTVEIKVRVGQKVTGGQAICVVEGEKEIETLSARNTSEVVSIEATDGTDVAKGTLLVTLREIKAG